MSSSEKPLLHCFNPQSWQIGQRYDGYFCRYCHRAVYFVSSVVDSSGRLVPDEGGLEIWLDMQGLKGEDRKMTREKVKHMFGNQVCFHDIYGWGTSRPKWTLKKQLYYFLTGKVSR